MTGDAIGGLRPQYQTYSRQKCFIAYSENAYWSVDLLSACEEVLSQPEYNLEVDYARKHFAADMPLRQKALELIANARYGIYDLSYWRQDERSSWQMPRNVMIELGIAIALNRPILLLRHASNRELPLPKGLQGISDRILEFSGTVTLKKVLVKHLSQWINTAPEAAWWNRYCTFGGQICAYREAHPRAEQLGRKELSCIISDGVDPCRPDFRSVLEDVLERFGDVTYIYLDSLLLTEGYSFLLCSHCQMTRSSPLAIYRITPHTPVEAFISLGINLALETQFEYKIPKILMAEDSSSVPTLLSGHEIVIARNDKERKSFLRQFMPEIINRIHQIDWKPTPLPFLNSSFCENEILLLENNSRSENMTIDRFWKLIEIAKKESRNDDERQVKILIQNLSVLSVSEIIEFQRIFSTLHEQSRHNYLWEAAEIIQGFCSDDGFEYFRAWLIAQGQTVFNNALEDPETLANFIDIRARNDCSLESMLYAADQAYKNKTKTEISETAFEELEKILTPTYGGNLREFPNLLSKFNQQEPRSSDSPGFASTKALNESINPTLPQAGGVWKRVVLPLSQGLTSQISKLRRRATGNLTPPQLNSIAIVVERIPPYGSGKIYFLGTYWAAKATQNITLNPDTKVKVVKHEGIFMVVEPMELGDR